MLRHIGMPARTAVCVLLTFMTASWAAPPETIDPAALVKQETCADGFDFKKESGSCVVAATLDEDKETCNKNPLLSYDDAARKCALGKDKVAPSPTCKPLDGYKATVKNAQCQYAKSTPVSALSDYLGDCFRVVTVPPGTGLKADTNYLTTGQGPKSTEAQDRMLTLVEAERTLSGLRIGLCAPKSEGKQFTGIKASDLALAGAYRTGWTFGALTMPYKYYRSERSFVTGAPLGLYGGLRFGQTGAALTLAAAFTLGAVTGDTGETKTDAQGVKTFTKTGTAQLMALSGSVGLIVDIFKSTEAKPFKIGLFVGQDRVNDEPTTYYRFNRKTWVAAQIGYDFTDN